MAGYNSAFSVFYDRLISDLDYAMRADYILNQISRFKDRCELVLDLACGTGSLSVELAKRGKEVIGVDASTDMLMQAMNKSMGIQPQILYLCQSMEELNLYGTVDAAICMQDSFNHLAGKEALQKAYNRLQYFIEPGGILIFDINTPYKHKHVLGNETFVYDYDDVYCVWQNFYNQDSGSVDICLDFFKNEEEFYYRSSETFTEYSYDIKSIEEMLNVAQFRLLEVQGDYNGLQGVQTDERWVIIAQRM